MKDKKKWSQVEKEEKKKWKKRRGRESKREERGGARRGEIRNNLCLLVLDVDKSIERSVHSAMQRGSVDELFRSCCFATCIYVFPLVSISILVIYS